MKPEALLEEKRKLEEKIRQIKRRLIQDFDQGRHLGLDRQVRQVQKIYRLIGRI